ncbi:MAG: hypothetical protein HYZ81_19825 [Nitrospinae bacterium]|nr:hypothetical protein [Nitrospinota bacterium]
MRYALVPVKDLTQAKARLSPLLSPAERYTLAAAMLDDVVNALRRASTLDRIAFVTADKTALALVVQSGFEVIDEGIGRGETGAVELGVKVCLERGASALAVIPGTSHCSQRRMWTASCARGNATTLCSCHPGIAGGRTRCSCGRRMRCSSASAHGVFSHM